MSASLESAGCAIAGCIRPLKALGLCHTHYMRQRRHGDPSVSLINREHSEVCSADGCGRPYASLGFCSMHWQRKNATGIIGPAGPLHLRYEPGSQCSVLGCGRRPQRRGLCEMHADRLDDTGCTGGPDPLKQPDGSGYIRHDGYIEVRCPVAHPLARNGRALVHRLVLWDHIGPGPHRCNWCSKSVDWMYGLTNDALVVDHVDFDTSNNDPSNLVPSCLVCNLARHP